MSVVGVYHNCFTLLQGVFPYRYGQWVIEDSENHDYRVISSLVLKGEAGYDVAHRTGVIGQVFRVEMPILVADAGNHPLYDPFDHAIDWELCFPVFMDGKTKAVINLEGTGKLEMSPEIWRRICDIIHESTQCLPPPSVPEVDRSYLVRTRRIAVRGAECDEVVEIARAIACGGESTLLVGDYPHLLNGRTPNMPEASQQGLSASYCYFGVERRLDLLATGSLSSAEVLGNRMDWWNTSKGRYAYVLIHVADKHEVLHVQHQEEAANLNFDIK